MRPPTIIIEYKVGGRSVRKRLGRDWKCPYCTEELRPEPGVPASQVRKLICSECNATVRVAQVKSEEIPKSSTGFRPRPKREK